VSQLYIAPGIAMTRRNSTLTSRCAVHFLVEWGALVAPATTTRQNKEKEPTKRLRNKNPKRHEHKHSCFLSPHPLFEFVDRDSFTIKIFEGREGKRQEHNKFK